MAYELEHLLLRLIDENAERQMPESHIWTCDRIYDGSAPGTNGQTASIPEIF